MSAVQLIALASTVSLLAGWRLYLVTFAVGLAMKFGWVALPQQLHALDVLANNWVIGIAALGTVAEFFADKIAWVDSLWDAIHSVVRPVGDLTPGGCGGWLSHPCSPLKQRSRSFS